MLRFFAAPGAPEEDFDITHLTHSDMRHILSHVTPRSLLVLDIDDTTARVSTTIGLDAWFRFRIQQFIAEGHEQSKAVESAVTLYETVQFASKSMVPVDKDNHMGELIKDLRARGTKVIGLTARGPVLADKTLELLATMGVDFSADALKDGEFTIKGKRVVTKGGVIFSAGSNKGECLVQVEMLGYISLRKGFDDIHFIDDNKGHCKRVGESLTALGVRKASIWHYTFAEEFLKFGVIEQAIAAIQEAALLGRDKHLLTDQQVAMHSVAYGI